MDAVGAARRRVVFVDHRLHSSLRIATSTTEILARIVDFILIERELGLGKIEPIVKRFRVSMDCALASAEVRSLTCVSSAAEGTKRLLQLPVDLFGFRRERPRLVRRLPNSLGESKIHLLVPEAQRIFGEQPLVRRSWQTHQLLGGEQGGLIDDDRPIGRRATGGARGRRGRVAPPGAVGTVADGDQRGDEDQDDTVLLESHRGTIGMGYRLSGVR